MAAISVVIEIYYERQRLVFGPNIISHSIVLKRIDYIVSSLYYYITKLIESIVVCDCI